jgi:hypothetical protein
MKKLSIEDKMAALPAQAFGAGAGQRERTLTAAGD